MSQNANLARRGNADRPVLAVHPESPALSTSAIKARRFIQGERPQPLADDDERRAFGGYFQSTNLFPAGP